MSRDIFVSSVFKSGTWLMRRIVSTLTSLEPYEPTDIPQPPDYGDASLIAFAPGHFFSWHSEINEPTRDLLMDRNAKVILQFRNIYDSVVSMYHHFADDTDADIGRSARQADFFRNYTVDEGLALIISGYMSARANWVGLGPHLAQVQDFFLFARDYPALLVSYERLSLEKGDEIRRIANYLEVPVDEGALSALVEASSFEAMRHDAKAKGEGSHFRKGRPGSHQGALRDYHVYMIEHALNSHAPRLRELAHEAGFADIVRFLGVEAAA